MKEIKVNRGTDGKWSIVEKDQLTKTTAIWFPIDNRRWDNEEDARVELASILGFTFKRQPKTEKKDIPLQKRSELRIVKIAKGIVVVEKNTDRGWVEVATKKTVTKAEKWCLNNSIPD